MRSQVCSCTYMFWGLSPASPKRSRLKHLCDLTNITNRIRNCGWTLVHEIANHDQLLALARSIGTPVQSPTGELIKGLRPIIESEARPNTLSANYGTGPFPLHTDTAFWSTPARYVLLRTVGVDVRRNTYVWSFERLLEESGLNRSCLVSKSIWTVCAGVDRSYCSMQFRVGSGVGWRYDSNCMLPANDAAREVEKILRPIIHRQRGEAVNLSHGDVIIIANWLVLHGRGPMPIDENDRVLERVYVR